MTQYQHIVITRFNLKRSAWVNDRSGHPVQTTEWMDHRIALFRRYCYPSMVKQTNQNYTWIILFDRDTPDEHRALMKDSESCPQIVPLYLEKDMPQEEIIDRVNATVDRAVDYLITTRLDNDDAFHGKAVEVIQSNYQGQSFQFMNLLKGYVVCGNQAYLVDEPSNPFITLVEKRSGNQFKTVLLDEHLLLHRHGPIKQICDQPYWLRVIHERNVLNDKAGVHCSWDRVRKSFPFIDDESGKEDWGS
jgi:hypothetical protein